MIHMTCYGSLNQVRRNQPSFMADLAEASARSSYGVASFAELIVKLGAECVR